MTSSPATSLPFEVPAPDPNEVAQRLRRLADAPVLADPRQQLRQLAAAVSGSGARRWAQLDILRALGADQPIGRAGEESRTVRFLETLRSTLIFCPIFVTWAGIAAAAKGYQKLVANDPAASGEPFLKLWLDGFHGHTAFTLEYLAYVTAALLFAIMASGALLDSRRRVEDQRQSQRAKGYADEMRSALVDASLVLAGQRFDEWEPLREQIAATAEELAEVVDRTREITTAITDAFSHLTAVAAKIQTGLKRAEGAARTIAESSDRASERIARSAGTVSDAVDSLDAGVRTSLDSLLSSMANLHAGSTAAMARAATTMENGIGNAVRATDATSVALADSAARAATAIASVEQLTERILDATRDGMHLSADTVAQILETARDGVKSNAEAVARSLTGVAAQVDASAGRLDDTIRSSADAIIRSTTVVLDQSDRIAAIAERTFDRAGQTVSDVHHRLQDKLAADNRSTELLSAHHEAVDRVSEVGRSIGELQATISNELAQTRATTSTELQQLGASISALTAVIHQPGPATPSYTPAQEPVPQHPSSLDGAGAAPYATPYPADAGSYAQYTEPATAYSPVAAPYAQHSEPQTDWPVANP